MHKTYQKGHKCFERFLFQKHTVLFNFHQRILTKLYHGFHNNTCIKGLVHPKMKIKSLITHPHAVPTP